MPHPSEKHSSSSEKYSSSEKHRRRQSPSSVRAGELSEHGAEKSGRKQRDVKPKKRLPGRALEGLKRRWRFSLYAFVALIFLALVAWGTAWTVPLPERLAQPPSTVVTFTDDSPAFVFLSPDEKFRMRATAEDLRHDEIDPDYIEALIRFEDRRFPFHPGVDPLAIGRSLWLNLSHGKIVSGASTLTMQLVRVLEPRPRRLSSKAIEAIRALQIELRMSKEEILAAYLSFIPFGRNLEGVATASHAYFGHGPQDLSADEIAVLLAVPQRPAQRYPAPHNQERLTEARDEIAAWLLDEGLLRPSADDRQTPEELLKQIQRSNVPREIRPLPRHAPHVAFWLRESWQGEKRDDPHHIPTTLDRGLQGIAERQMAAAHPESASLGIHNGAMVVVDHRSSDVKALVGNFDFWDADHGGQLVGFNTPRSPGSALKPFLYALAIDRGLAMPAHLVPDIPTNYGDYSPDNYDGTFTGLIALEEALSFSLNIPFVRLLGQLGVESFLGTLRAMNVDHLQDEPGYYGLSAAIGSVEITPLEMAGLYAALAQSGRYRPLRWLKDEEDAGFGIRVFSEGSAYLTRQALTRRDRPDFPERRRFAGLPPRIHWKTGTSYGHRDAWAAGSGPQYSAVVWLGNFDREPSVDLVGADAAGPILFDLLEAIGNRSNLDQGDPRPGELKQVEVCAYSGHLPTASCKHREFADALRHKVPTKRCPYHVSIDVDLDTGLALNPTCRAGRRYESREYVVWPASIRRWLAQGHQVLPSPPSLAPDCETTQKHRAPSILSPPLGQTLVLLPGLPTSDQEVPLQAETHGSNTRLSWFVDGKFLGTVEGEEQLWWQPEPGQHEFLVIDETGQSSKRRLRVSQRQG